MKILIWLILEDVLQGKKSILNPTKYKIRSNNPYNSVADILFNEQLY